MRPFRWPSLSADPPRSPSSAPPGWAAGVGGKRRRGWGEAFGEMGGAAGALARPSPGHCRSQVGPV